MSFGLCAVSKFQNWQSWWIQAKSGAYGILSPCRSSATLQRERLRLAYEYLRRISHNAEVIQTWVVKLYEHIKYKTREEFTEQDYLIWELVEVSTELRVYTVFALMRVLGWMVFRVDLWPAKAVPRLTGLRVMGGVDVVKKYEPLIAVTTSLSRTYGQTYYEE
jgi:hypothetical protein